MEINDGQIFELKIKTLPILEFIDMYHKGLTYQAVKEAIKRDDLDYKTYKRGKYNQHHIVLTLRTLNWKPNYFKVRDTKVLNNC